MRPIARFVVERDGVEQASAVLGRAEIFEREPLEYAVARLSWAEGGLGAARAAVTAAVDSAPRGVSVYLPVNAAVSSDHAARRDVAQACGFEVFQEKEGFRWADTGQALFEPVGLRLEPMSRIGREAFVSVIGRCVAQTLDRTDALVFGRHQPQQWATTFLDHSASAADAQSWLYAETTGGVPVGFVGLAQRDGDPGAGTIVLIGVLPEQRGHRYVDQLLLAAYRAARVRGFAEVLSLVDVDNHPMMAAVVRSGADPDADPWHKWLYTTSPPRRAGSAAPIRW
ncbi:GNAT family N-acetyltransferase [Amycolatopsis carbonis]|uniref:GNAT family N-acetyltransferase n=1 Tax=Amycolatopsis carbonis TaxID=715471 RepID=A0A9Y2IBU9_9PSEU|nr:GNAT family N-acetyltransferase [Amycolatopsis sp. 2-15]WIX76245.1 GNAT family N-acetyltransferase [Amycolatopsis sp. 2-15]